MLELIKPICTLLGFFLMSACSTFDFPDPEPRDYPVHGIDISRWQGDIDWHQVKRAGTAFAWIKATEGGDHMDPLFAQNWRNAAAAGVNRGAYHFYFMCRPVEDQIAWVKQVVPVDPNALPLALDMEWNAHSKTCQERPERPQILRDMKLFLDEMERHYGKRPVIYVSVDFHRDRLVGAFRNEEFWVRSVAAFPDRVYEQRSDWVFWQYTAEGRVPGIRGDVDRNAFVGSRKEFNAWLRGERTR